ncbi:hypothetical protein EI94DRAFT_201393 [Lactarius quietus]|nr:hypothetical protein EI94DRAFT_201393 [Lactarius quietus]
MTSDANAKVKPHLVSSCLTLCLEQSRNYRGISVCLLPAVLAINHLLLSLFCSHKLFFYPGCLAFPTCTATATPEGPILLLSVPPSMLKVQARSIEDIQQRLVALDTSASPEWRKQKRWHTTTSHPVIDHVCVDLPNRNIFPFRKRNTSNFLCLVCTGRLHGAVRSQSRRARLWVLSRSVSFSPLTRAISDHPSLSSQSPSVALRLSHALKHPNVPSHQILSVIRRRRRYTRYARTRIGLVCPKYQYELAPSDTDTLEWTITWVRLVDVFWKMMKHACSPYLIQACATGWATRARMIVRLPRADKCGGALSVMGVIRKIC